MTSGEGGQSAVSSCAQIDPRIVMAGLFLIAMIPLMATPVLPLIDFYNHLARFYVLSHIGTSAWLQQNYEVYWSLIPDVAGDALAMPILRILPPLAAGHVIVAGILAVLYGGVLYLNRALTGRHSLLVAVLLLPLLYSYILNWGFANFLLGLGLAFWGAGWWLRHRHRPLFAVPVSCLIAIVIFFAHGAAFVLYGIMVASLEIGLFLDAPGRRFSNLVYSLSLAAAQAIVPVAFFIYWRVLTHSLKAAGVAAASKVAVTGASVPDGYLSLYRLGTILRVEESPAYWFDIATFLIQAVMLGTLIRRGRLVVSRPARPALVAAAVMIAIVPSMAFGAWYISDRIPLFAALLLLSALFPAPGEFKREARIACGVLAAVAIARLCFIAINWHGYGQDFREFQSVAARIPQGSRTIGIAVGGGHHAAGVRRCEMFAPLLIAQYGQVGPMFSDKSLHPIALAGGLKAADDRLRALMPVPPDEATGDFNPYMTAALTAGYDYVLACNTQLLVRPYASNLAVIDRTEHFALIGARHR